MKETYLEKLYLKIRVDKVHFLKFIIEAYDGLALLSSPGAPKDVILIRFPVEVRGDVIDLLTDLAATLNPYK